MISPHISEKEAFYNEIAEKYHINNKPGNKELSNMKALACEVFEKIRNHFGVPILVTSFFRCLEVELKAGRNGRSQHVRGEGIDVKSGSKTVSNAEIFLFIRDHLVFDQLIWEKGDDSSPAWVHVSYSQAKNRKQVLKTKDGVKYEIFNS